MIKYSELENDFTIDCDGCGNFYVVDNEKLDLTCDLYRFCSDRCKVFVLNRIELIKKNLEPKH